MTYKHCGITRQELYRKLAMWLPYPLLRIELRWNATIVQMWTNISSGIQFVSHQRRIYGSYSAGRKLSLTALITILAVKSVKDLTSSRENNGSPFSKLVKLVRIRLKFKVRYILVCFVKWKNIIESKDSIIFYENKTLVLKPRVNIIEDVVLIFFWPIVSWHRFLGF